MTTRIHVKLFGGPIVLMDGRDVKLTPYQRAFVAIVYAHGSVSRREAVQLLWNRRIDSKSRASVRQLRHQVNRRANAQIIGAVGEDLLVPDWVECDVALVNEALASDHPHVATDAVIRGFASHTPLRISQSFVDWQKGRDDTYRNRLHAAVLSAWERYGQASEWRDAAATATSLIKIEGVSPAAYARLIEAQARAGCIREAEITYSDYRRDCPHDASAGRVDSLMRRVRSLSNDSRSMREAIEIPFVGRRRELAAMLEITAAVATGRCTFGRIRGEAGIGKTRLLNEVRRLATLDGFQCLVASPTPFERRISLSPIFDAIEPIDLLPHLESIGEPWRSVVASMIPPGWNVGKRSAPPPIEDTALTRRLMESFSLLLHSIAAEKPTLLFLDDAHWADTTTLMLLDFYQKRWGESPFGLFMALRPEPADSDRAWNPIRSAEMKTLDLIEMSDDDGRKLIEVSTQGRCSEAQADGIIAIAGLHPLYVVEVARELVDRRMETWESEGGRVPVSVQHLVEARLAGASSDAIRALRMISVCGRSTQLPLLARLLDKSIEATAALVDTLLARRLVEFRAGSVDVSHGLFRRCVYQNTQPALRSVFHRGVASELIAEQSAHPGEIAIHLDSAGDAEGAASHGWLAANAYVSQGALAEASELFGLVARNESDPNRQADALTRSADAGFLARDLPTAVDRAVQASQSLVSVGRNIEASRLDVRRVSALNYMRRQSLTESLHELSKIRAGATAAGSAEVVALTLEAELQALFRYDSDSGVEQVLGQMRTLATRSRGEAALVCHLGLALGVVFGDAAEGLRSARLAESLSREFPAYRATALTRLLVVLLLKGRLLTEEGASVASAAIDEAEAKGDARLRFAALSNLAIGLLDSGEPERAEVCFERAADSVGPMVPGMDTFNWYFNRGELELSRREFAAARSLFQLAEEQLGVHRPAFVELLVDARVGLCALETGDLGEARRREAKLPTDLPEWCYDPYPLVEFRTRLFSLRGRLEAAMPFIDSILASVEGRLELAWLRLGVLRAEVALRLGRRSEVLSLTPRYLKFAAENRLARWERRLSEIRDEAAVYEA